MSQKTINITGWVLTIILGLLFIMSASTKFIQNAAVLQQAAAMGFSPGTYLAIGVVEIASLILFLIPRTAVIGALLLVAYMGGAIATHVQHQLSAAMPIAIEVLLWITIAIRFPQVRQQLLLQSK
ncbi:MAG: DoxX family protein [Niabella sp.]|nr:DoxX family protein [Niabella sp.]